MEIPIKLTSIYILFYKYAYGHFFKVLFSLTVSPKGVQKTVTMCTRVISTGQPLFAVTQGNVRQGLLYQYLHIDGNK